MSNASLASAWVTEEKSCLNAPFCTMFKWWHILEDMPERWRAVGCCWMLFMGIIRKRKRAGYKGALVTCDVDGRCHYFPCSSSWKINNLVSIQMQQPMTIKTMDQSKAKPLVNYGRTWTIFCLLRILWPRKSLTAHSGFNFVNKADQFWLNFFRMYKQDTMTPCCQSF